MRPLLLFDGNCAFCRRWVARWRARTGDAVIYRRSRRARRAVQLIDSDGKRYAGAEAVFRALGRAPRLRLVAAIGRWPVVRWLAGRAYRFVAAHRTSAARVDRLLFGTSTAAPSRRVVRWLFLRCLGGVYLIAFTSLRVQVLGLYGSRGIEPIGKLLGGLRAAEGRDAYRIAPTLLWLRSSDRDLVRFCGAGQLCAVALMLGVAPRAMAAALWALYLSFVSVGRDFLSFQWDALLLETGAHAMLVGPSTSGRDRPGEPPWLGALLMRWLVFRLHFQSGLVKLRSRDPSWRRCTACAYHYQTQPLPTRVGWYASHLPRAIQKLSTAATLAIELAAPPLVFGPRRVRKAAVSALTGLQLLIAATGNYAFFNVLTIALGLWVLDDSSFGRLGRVAGLRARGRRPTSRWLRIPLRVAHTAVAAVVAIVSAATFTRRGFDRPLARRLARPLARAAARLTALVEPARSINPYGLFAVMTTERPEIVVEGSDDGQTWREYRFRHKPSRPEDPPRWVAPHQPRLDWQMWFAALGAPPDWFAAFLARLLQGSPDVLALLASNPFPAHPPRYIRALLYDYQMTDRPTRARTGAWWHRRLLGTYFPPSMSPHPVSPHPG